MPRPKLTIEKDARGGWKVSEQTGSGKFELKVKDSNTERNPDSVEVYRVGANEPTIIVDP